MYIVCMCYTLRQRAHVHTAVLGPDCLCIDTAPGRPEVEPATDGARHSSYVAITAQGLYARLLI